MQIRAMSQAELGRRNRASHSGSAELIPQKTVAGPWPTPPTPPTLTRSPHFPPILLSLPYPLRSAPRSATMPGRAGDLHGDEALPGRAACELEETRSPPPRWRSRSARRARAPPRPEPWPPGRAMVRTHLMRARPATESSAALEIPFGPTRPSSASPRAMAAWTRPSSDRPRPTVGYCNCAWRSVGRTWQRAASGLHAGGDELLLAGAPSPCRN
jgi:hypothetical protein